MYSVKEIFYTLQGEGAHSGRPAVFCRFSGCNLWSGRKQERAGAICSFCDTDFVSTDGVNGGQYKDPCQLAKKCRSIVPRFENNMLIVLTGGEPLLQIDKPLIAALGEQGFMVGVETNGTINAPPELDWVCVSPKAGAEFIQHSGNEIKIVMPQEGLDPNDFTHLAFDHFYIQPMDNANYDANLYAAIAYCKAHPQWKLSLQTHKIVNIP